VLLFIQLPVTNDIHVVIIHTLIFYMFLCIKLITLHDNKYCVVLRSDILYEKNVKIFI
jgi:hypothetical protein